MAKTDYLLYDFWKLEYGDVNVKLYHLNTDKEMEILKQTSGYQRMILERQVNNLIIDLLNQIEILLTGKNIFLKIYAILTKLKLEKILKFKLEKWR